MNAGRRHRARCTCLVVVLGLVVGGVHGGTPATIDLRSSVIAGGATQARGAGDWSLDATVHQADAARSVDGTLLVLEGGFWPTTDVTTTLFSDGFE